MVGHLAMANSMLAELLKLKPWVKYKSPPKAEGIKQVMITTFSDASFNQSTGHGYGQTGFFNRLRIVLHQGMDYYHLLDWCSNKQKRVSYSPYGADILACADADDRGFYLKYGIRCIFPKTEIRNELLTDSKCLYDTITTLHEGRDDRLRPTVQRMRNSFDAKELEFM